MWWNQRAMALRMGMAKPTAIVCFAVTVAGSVAADDHAPRSLRMRGPRPTQLWQDPMQLGPRVALQLDPPPDDTPPPPPSETPPPSPDDAPPPPPPTPAPPPPARPATPPAGSGVDDGKNEVITVTGEPI